MNKYLLSALLFGATTFSVSAAEPQDLVLDQEHSPVHIAVKATGDSFTGQLSNYVARIQVTDAAPGVVALSFKFRFADIHTGKEKRDAKMQEWQQTEKFPDGEFTLIKLTPLADGRATAAGQLRFHGVSREISFPVTIKQTPDRHYSFDGEAVVDTQAYDLPIIKVMGFLKVDPLVKIQFHLEGEAGS